MAYQTKISYWREGHCGPKNTCLLNILSCSPNTIRWPVWKRWTSWKQQACCLVRYSLYSWLKLGYVIFFWHHWDKNCVINSENVVIYVFWWKCDPVGCSTKLDAKAETVADIQTGKVALPAFSPYTACMAEQKKRSTDMSKRLSTNPYRGRCDCQREGGATEQKQAETERGRGEELIPCGFHVWFPEVKHLSKLLWWK